MVEPAMIASLVNLQWRTKKLEKCGHKQAIGKSSLTNDVTLNFDLSTVARRWLRYNGNFVVNFQRFEQ